MENMLREVSFNFFTKLGVEFTSLEVDSTKDGSYLIHIESNDSALLIGPHGDNAEALRRILSILANTSLITETNIKIKLEINDYYQSKHDALIHFIDSRIHTFLQGSLREYKLPQYSSYERKKIHSYVSSLPGNIKSESRGEGKERRMFLVKSMPSSKLSIDIEGDMI